MLSATHIWGTLKARVILMTMAIIVVGVWSLALFSGALLQADMQQLVGEQQLSAATIVAAEVNKQFEERLQALQRIAGQITPEMMGKPAALQAFLEGHLLLQDHFNAGLFVVGADGVARASVPVSIGRLGVSFKERDHIRAALTQNRVTISEPVIGKMLKTPVISIAAPVHDANGAPMGALTGVINLSQPNFLDLIIGQHYGRSGSYFVIDPRHQTIVTATDKRFNLTPLPALAPVVGGNAIGDPGGGASVQGAYVSAGGVESLTAMSVVPSAGWYLAILLPVDEAFAPINTLKSRLLKAAALVTVLAALIIWRILLLAMRPLQVVADALDKLPVVGEFPPELPVTSDDEVGRVVMAFNRLLASLRTQDSILRQSEAQLVTAQTIAGLGSYVLHGPTGSWKSSQMLDTLFGVDASYERSVQSWLDILHPDDRDYMDNYFSGLCSRAEPEFDATYRIVRPSDGQMRWLHGIGRLEFDSQGQFQQMIGVVQDVTDSRRVQLRLNMLSSISEQAPIAIVIVDLNGTIEFVNPHFEKVTGYSFQEAVGQNPRILQSGQTDPAVYRALWDRLTAGEVWQGEFQNRKKNGELFVEWAVIAPIHNASGLTTHYVALKEDITERKRAQTRLQESLNEKTALLNEVHHRVKNNLQVIASLLRLESKRSSHADTKNVLGDMQGRIRSMAQVHEALYRSGNFAAVDLKDYLEQVATGTFRAQSGNGSVVRLVLNLQAVRVGLDQATPCGLLVNELVTNSVKHGFTFGMQGEVRVELQRVQPEAATELWRLRVVDNGVGLAPDFEARRTKSLGLQLVSDLAGQLGGELKIDQSQDLCFEVTFPLNQA